MHWILHSIPQLVPELVFPSTGRAAPSLRLNHRQTSRPRPPLTASLPGRKATSSGYRIWKCGACADNGMCADRPHSTSSGCGIWRPLCRPAVPGCLGCWGRGAHLRWTPRSQASQAWKGSAGALRGARRETGPLVVRPVSMQVIVTRAISGCQVVQHMCDWRLEHAAFCHCALSPEAQTLCPTGPDSSGSEGMPGVSPGVSTQPSGS